MKRRPESDVLYTPQILRLFQNVQVFSEAGLDGRSFCANVNVLACTSPYLRTVLMKHFEECDNEDTAIILSGFSEELTGYLDRYIHTGSVRIPVEEKNKIQCDFEYFGIPFSERFKSSSSSQVKETFPNVIIKEEVADFDTLDLKLDEDHERMAIEESEVRIDNAAFEYEKLVVFEDERSKVGDQLSPKNCVRYFRCWLCPFICHLEKQFKSHVEIDHPDFLSHVSGPFSCKICAKPFKTLQSFCHHLTKMDCGQWYEKGLRYHKYIAHQKEGEVACNDCGKVFPTTLRMRQHVHKTHSQKQCDKCSKIFPSGFSLNKHIINVHTEDHLKPFICNICGKGFGTRMVFNQHMDIHNNVKRYKCRICEYRTAVRSNRVQHERSVHEYEHQELGIQGDPVSTNGDTSSSLLLE